MQPIPSSMFFLYGFLMNSLCLIKHFCFIFKPYLFFSSSLSFHFIFPVAVAGSSVRTIARKESSGSVRSLACSLAGRVSRIRKAPFTLGQRGALFLQQEPILQTREGLVAITPESSGAVDGHLGTSDVGLGPVFRGGDQLFSSGAVCS